ncbi:hypothetical protein SLEP1_g8534 [Rubroshorea leprosula]|uniref:Uncharacterized protein n=1 Tax=Rubroshorea leprosula TaxID=152421 RepID=A0AAV5I7X6_9ROSI|nr:hypothetical protein SLEP1_g8534 [Rubroshorea leprosula]
MQYSQPADNLLEFRFAGLYPKGSPSRNSRRPESSPGQRGGLEIVFNQQ